MFRGSIVAIVTPFRDGRVDEDAFRKLIEFHIREGTDAIVPCGTTGESATLSHEEHERVVEIAVETAAKRVPIIAGTGSNSTAEAIRLTQHAREAGADGALLITPYYNKPTQEGLFQHFKAVAAAADVPIVLYNVPSRTGVNLLPQTIARLAGVSNIVAVKEASGSLTQVSEIVALCGEKITVLSGDDPLTLPMLAVGARGVISVTANVAPGQVAALIKAFESGDLAQAREIHYRLRALNDAMFYETNPIPVKTALGLMGMIHPELRLPLCPMGEANLARLKGVLQEFGLLP
ncbi:MAG: 4-hydroxy-tetrahydrodipicolinate synthase [Candidatus Tectomicrobia bacterium]|uniref:4-hydroxy-tetrahydrodipicolinate synthase n=1 Tax=Tectimicrobiota bacterium TaxID=2528274 RepID=A0A932GR36_UNCTE|nr:4-hydroxy-tetrahydrodipicolinate synthase [Candidatus Tectomicrobia bacterium]